MNNNIQDKHIWFGVLFLTLCLLASLLAGGTAQADGPEVDNLPGTGPEQSDGAGVDGESFTRAGSPLAGAPGWMQSNTSGFGDPSNYVIGALAGYKNQLFAGTWTLEGSAQLWISSDGGYTWGQLLPGWSAANKAITDLEPFGASLYVGTYRNGGGKSGVTTARNLSEWFRGGWAIVIM